MQYWLLKAEPGAFSIADFKRNRVASWDGVRNYQARNMMRDLMKRGDLAFFITPTATRSALRAL
jgi:predicted RNA-binding protein with PUA-like domain